MRKPVNSQPIALVLGAAVAATSLGAQASVFKAADLPSGYQQLADHGKPVEGKCGEGKCGEMKCGAKKEAAKSAEPSGKTGQKPAADSKMKEGKCGEGKCGGSMR